MILENKLNITDQTELAREEERISKKKAKEMFETDFFNSLEAGTFESLKQIHKYLFEEIYDFAGEIRKVNVAKGNFRFIPIAYLEEAIKKIEKNMVRFNSKKRIECSYRLEQGRQNRSFVSDGA